MGSDRRVCLSDAFRLSDTSCTGDTCTGDTCTGDTCTGDTLAPQGFVLLKA